MTSPSAEEYARLHRAVFFSIVICAVVPGVVTLLAVIAQLQWLSEMPQVVAIHWAGRYPDGFAPRWTYPLLTALVAILVLGVAVLAPVIISLKTRHWGAQTRISSAIGGGATIGLVALQTLLAHAHLGISDPATIAIGSTLLIAGAIAVGFGLVAYLAQPATIISHPERTKTVQASAKLKGLRIAWFSRTSASPAILWGFGVLIAFDIGLAVFLSSQQSGSAWILAGVAVLLLLVGAGSLGFRAQADSSGLTVSSWLGWPKIQIPPEDIVEISVTQISPMRDFGGIGYRFSGDRSGVVLRSGAAIQVKRRNGKTFVLTVPDADRGAAALAALVDASH